MQNSELILSISTDRIATYKRLFNEIVYEPAEYDEQAKLIFYLEIQTIYSHLFIPIQTLEVVLRNRIHHFQSIHWTTSSWFKKLVNESYATEKTKSMFDSARKQLKKDFKEKGITNRGPTPADFVGKLNFGFWVDLLHANYRSKQFWQFYGLKVFPNKDGVRLGEVYDLLFRIQGVRNRLYHYEPLWETKRSFKDLPDFCSTLEDVYYLVIKLIGFMSVEYQDLLEDHVFYFELAISDFKSKYS